jgi:hypothetical protein
MSSSALRHNSAVILSRLQRVLENFGAENPSDLRSYIVVKSVKTCNTAFLSERLYR